MAWKDDDIFRGGEESGYRGPSVDEIVLKVQESIRRWGGKRVLLIFIGIILVIWLASGIYIVGPGEMGVIRQFGKEVDQTSPGLRYRLPWPIQTRDVLHLASVARAEIGFGKNPSTGKARHTLEGGPL